MKNDNWFLIEPVAHGYIGYGKCGTFFGATRMLVITQLLNSIFYERN